MVKRESLQEKFERETGQTAVTKAGAKTKVYTDYLLSDKCSVPWMANWGTLYSKNEEVPYKSGAELLKDLAIIDKNNRLAEKCARGGIGKGERLKAVAKFRRDSKSKYDIENY